MAIPTIISLVFSFLSFLQVMNSRNSVTHLPMAVPTSLAFAPPQSMQSWGELSPPMHLSDDHHNQCKDGYLSAGTNEQMKMKTKQWSILLKDEICSADESFWSNERTIMLAPKVLYDVRSEAYTPRLVFIGPLTPQLSCVAPLTVRSCMETNGLSTMDRYKAQSVKKYLEGCPSQSNLHNLMARIFHGSGNPGAAYFDIPNYFQKEDLQLLITVDSVFVLDLLTKFTYQMPCRRFLDDITLNSMLHDLFIVGNQVPLSYLVKLAAYHGLLQEELIDSLEIQIWISSPFTSSDHFQYLVDGPSLLKCEHLLDCLYQACLNNTREEADFSNNASDMVKMKKVPRASELHKVGVKFKGIVNGNATTISYDEKNLTLVLPKLLVYDNTECVLRNLIAYEYTSKKRYDICKYAVFMDELIDNVDDLDILYRAGVIENHLGSEEKLIAMWNDMCVKLILHRCAANDRLVLMKQAIVNHYDTNWRQIYVEFCRRYFSKPWYAASAIAAVLLLFMSGFQAVYTAMSYYKP